MLKKIKTSAACAFMAGFAAPMGALAELLPVDLDQVDFSPARYQLIQHGENLGEMFYAMERSEKDIIIHDGTTLLPDIRESGTLVIDTETLLPKRIVIDGDFSRTILDVDLTFEERQGAGVYRIKQPGETEKADRPFEIELPEDAIARASIFGLVTGMPIKEGAAFQFQWFSELSGAIADAEIIVVGTETIEVPAGVFETYVIKLNAQPANVLYLTREAPHQVVRIDVPDQDMRFERLATDNEAK